MVLAKGPRTASIQERLDCLGLNHWGLEGERHFRLAVELPLVPPDAYPACAGPPGDFNGYARDFGHGAPWVGEGLHLFARLPGRFDLHHCPRCVRWRHAHGPCLLHRHD